MVNRDPAPAGTARRWPDVDRAALRSAVLRGRRSGALRLLVALLALIPVLLVGHLMYTNGIGPFTSRRWYVDRDRSFMEILGYVQVLGAGLLLVLLAVQRRVPVYAGWGAALTVVVLDDALEWHETAGAWLERTLPLPSVVGLRPQDVGELLVWGALGAGVLLVLVVTHVRSTHSARVDSWRLGGLIGLLTVFAVGVDMAHVALATVTSSSRVDLLALWLESSGEVGVMAGLLAYAVHIARRRSGSAARQAAASVLGVSQLTVPPVGGLRDARAQRGDVRT